jgi:RNA polymerase sigma-70 factor (ECF subfamily)
MATQENLVPRLSLISTHWTLIRQSHEGGEKAALAARRCFFERYGGAVRRYLLGAVRDPEAADDLYQDFAYRFLRGDLRGADPERGRFRHFLKGVLSHLVADYFKRRRRQPRALPVDCPEPAGETAPAGEDDQKFLEDWRDELLARAWQGLAEAEGATGQPFYTVLRFRANHPDLHSPEMAGWLSSQFGRPQTALGVRQLLHRARERFADLLLDEVRQSLATPTEEEVAQELLELGLLDYCKPALERSRRPGFRA